jgi:hypothetical protein
MILFMTLIMVDDTICKSLIMGYQSLKYNFILKKQNASIDLIVFLRWTFWYSRYVTLQK